MINMQSILSLFDDKPTLLKWLKKVEAALAASVLTSVTISQPSETTAVLTFNFEDGTNIETPAITLPRGASVVNAMLDANNNLILVLDDGRQINVGNIMPANINAQNGTFSVSLTTPSATISVGTIGNLSVTSNLSAESVDVAGSVYAEGGITAEGTLHTDENLEVGGNAAITGSVTAASFSGENARPLYRHFITAWSADYGNISFELVNSSGASMTKQEVIALMKSKPRFGPLSGVALYSGNKILVTSYCFYSDAADDVFMMGIYTDGSVEDGNGRRSIVTFINNAVEPRGNYHDDVERVNA